MRRSYKNRNRAKSQHSLSAQVGQLVGIISTILSRKIWVVCLVIAAIALGVVGPVHDFYVARRTGDVLEQKKKRISKKKMPNLSRSAILCLPKKALKHRRAKGDMYLQVKLELM